jgi:D-cysteine desulfhydrase
VAVDTVGVDVSNLWTDFGQDILDMAGRVTARLGIPRAFAAGDLTWHPGAGPGYAKPHAPAQAAVELAARSEGLLLDPVYTGKALAGLIDLIRTGRFRPDQHVIFLHTGGAPALFAGA